jgi:DsbC/DsbD-like thiol-disulfide interchange protein
MARRYAFVPCSQAPRRKCDHLPPTAAGAKVISAWRGRPYVRTMRLMFLALPILAITAQVRAETQDDVLSARMLPGWQTPDGHRMAGLSLTLAPGWKTYWRAPGEAGIPPVFDWSGSANLKSVALHWPSPSVIEQNGMTSVGYMDGLTLPVEVVPMDPAKPVHLALKMDLGLCHDICMPATIRLAADLGGPGARDPAIATALDAAPMGAAAAGLSALSCQVAPIDDGLRVTARLDLPPQGTEEDVVFEAGEPDIWVSQATSVRDGRTLTASVDLVPPAGKPFALDRSGLTVSILAKGRSVELHGCPAP